MAKKQIQQMISKYQAAPGQALVEFALIITFVLTFFFIIIESGRMFQAWQTVQNAAREAGRYALTGGYDAACLSATPPCFDPRVHSIRQKSLASVTGLVINPNAGYNDPNFFYTEIWGANEDGVAIPEYAGASNQPVYIRVTYRIGLITPFLSSLVPSVRLIGTVTVNNEDFEQYGATVTNPSGAPGGDFQPPPIVELVPDLWLQKESIPASTVVDSVYEYRLTIYNIGPVLATNVVLTDTLPAGVTFLTASAIGGCTHDSGVVVCANLGDIPPNPNQVNDPALRREIIIQVRAPQNIVVSPTTIVNTATTAAAQTELITSNNTATAATQIIGDGSDLQIFNMTSAPAPVKTGQDFTLTIAVRNNGPNNNPVNGVAVETTLENGLVFREPNNPDCTYNAATRRITCLVGTLIKNETRQIPITIGTPGQMTEPISFVHVATVYPILDDPLPDNNTRSSFTTVVPSIADLRVTKSSSPSSIMRGQNVTYNIQIVNFGPAEATNIVVTDTLPPNTIFQSATPPGIACAHNGGSPGLVTCTIPALSPNTGNNTTNIAITVLRPTGGSADTLINRVDVAASEVDPNMANNTAFATTQIVEVDLALTKTPTDNPTVFAGRPFTFTITVINNGPSPATGIIISDTLVANLHFLQAIPSQGLCSYTAPLVTCNIGSLSAVPGSNTATVALVVVPTVGGTGSNVVVYTNVASVSGAQGDPNLTNNHNRLNPARISVERATAPFITVTPTCGDYGTSVTVNGYNFSNPTRELGIIFNPGTNQTVWKNPANTPQVSQNWTMGPYTIPSNVPFGSYTVRANKGSGSQLEFATTQFKVPCPKPDLVIGNLQVVTAQPTSNLPVEFSAVISNTGEVEALSQFFVSIYVNPPAPAANATHIVETYRAGIIAVNGLAINQSLPVTITASAAWFPITGTYQIYAVVDSDPATTGVINELYETNNIARLTPDLIISAAGEPPGGGGPGDQTGILNGDTQIELVGGFPVPQRYVTVKLYNQVGDLIAEATSNGESIYRIIDVPVLPEGSFYIVTGCIIIDNQSYYGQSSGFNVQEYVPGDETTETIIQSLTLTSGSCFE